jgi:hypothetical protein
MSPNDFPWVSVKPSAAIFRLMDWRMLLKTDVPHFPSFSTSGNGRLLPKVDKIGFPI